MSWLAYLAAASLQPAPAAPPAETPAPARTAPAPVRPRPWPPMPPSLVYFALDSARVEGQANAVLDALAEDYRRNGRVTVEIVANADHSGPSALNRRLSERRARAVAAALVRRGIPRGVITLRPTGENEPHVMTPDGVREPLNRYAEIRFPEPAPR